MRPVRPSTASAEATTTAKAFETLGPETAVPNVWELEAAVGSLLTEAQAAVGLARIDLSKDALSSALAALLSGTTVSADQRTIRLEIPSGNGGEGGLVEEIRLSATKNAEGAVVFSGETRVTEGGGAAPPGATSATFVAPIYASVRRLGTAGPNQAWMGDMRATLGPRRLADVTLPGTHDSGTSGIGPRLVFLPWGTAKTQTRNIGEQLNDGIRYFDLRVSEVAHRGCADPSVWWLYHTFDSYRLQDALRQIKAFVQDPAHAREVIILDFQDVALKYDDARAAAVLFTSIQNELGDYLFEATDANYAWAGPKTDITVNGDVVTPRAKTLQEIWNANATSGKKKQIVVLLPGGWLKNPPSGCGSSWDTRYFRSRDEYVKSYYGERADPGPLMADIEVQLSQEAAKTQNRLDRFNEYKAQQDAGRLNVLQIVSRPSDLWYVLSSSNPLLGETLLDYANRINRAFNTDGSCDTAWFGKRLWMGYNPEQTYRGPWNRGNIVIIDNYDALQNWITASWTGSGWRKTSKGGYVDFIRRINQNPDPVSSGTSPVSTFADGTCL